MRFSLFGIVEFALLRWKPGECTNAHDHGGAACAYVVLSGVVRERRWAPPSYNADPTQRRCFRMVRSRYLQAGDTCLVPRCALHDVSSECGALTFHVYWPKPDLTAQRAYPIALD